jgi:type IV pilus assembly protein PilE
VGLRRPITEEVVMHGSGAWHNTPTRAPTSTRARGFTLVELMITVAIVSLLTMIAVPSYSYFMKKSRRGDAEATLMDIAQREQQYLNDARAYAPDTVTLNTTVPGDVSNYYTITICAAAPPAACAAPGGAPPTFVVVATPIAGSVQAGDFTLTLDNTGARGPITAW